MVFRTTLTRTEKYLGVVFGGVIGLISSLII